MRAYLPSLAFLVVALSSCSDDPNTLGRGGRAGTGTSGTSDATASGGTDGTGDTSGTAGTSPDAAEICLASINGYRTSKGLRPYVRWAEGEACADTQSQSDATSKTPHGAFGTCGEFAQNECPGWPGPAGEMIPGCLKAMWGEGPGGGHYDAMASTRFTQVACGFGTAADGSVWSAQNFR